MSLLSDAEQTELRHQQVVTYNRLRGATSSHTAACGCGLCRDKRRLAQILEEPGEADRFKLLVEKIGRRISGIGGGA